MIRRITLATAAVTMLSTLSAHANEPCVENFSVKGSFFSGKQYATWQTFEEVQKADAFNRIYAVVVKEDYKINSTDREAGIISAEQQVSYGSGKTAPLNVIVEANDTGSKVSISYSTSGGVAAGEKAVKEGMCNYLKAVSTK